MAGTVMLVAFAAGCTGGDGQGEQRSATTEPAVENDVAPVRALAPGTVEELNRVAPPVRYASKRPEAQASQERAEPASSGSLGGMSGADFAKMMNSKIIRRSPELGRILAAMRRDPSAKNLREVARTLPIQKSVALVPGANGMQRVTTYSYKGRQMLRLHGGATTGGLNVSDADMHAAPHTQRHESLFRPAAFVVSSAVQEEDPLLDVDELGNGIAELEALEYELVGIDVAEEYEFIDWEGWYNTQVVSFERNGSSPRWTTVARSDCGSGPTAARLVSSMAQSCFDQHYAKVLEAGGAYAVLRGSISAARAAYTAAWTATGTGAVVRSSVRVSVMFGWIGVGALAVGTVGYGAYQAYQCYNSRHLADWLPGDFGAGSTVRSLALLPSEGRHSERWSSQRS